jgi:hypothetical protein
MTAKACLDGVVCRVGIAGVDLVHSWHWTAQTKSAQPALPIDRYRTKRPRGLDMLIAAMTEERKSSEVCA